ncbi:MAG: PQQ-binding-like beta-propeller repeat protein [Ignavibacteria bacterium]|nr:PQQ-binding-like beta-propeller repeat protein [Ignavibacteria bacterium]
MDKDVRISESDWLMCGGNIYQNNVSAYILNPPLYLWWEYNLDGGTGKNSITVADAVVFVNAMQGYLYSIDISSGGKIGSLNFLGKDAQTAPVILGNELILAFAGDKRYSLISYDVKNSLIKWRKHYGDIQSSPIYYNGNIFFGNLLGKFYKVDVSNGKMLWKFESRSLINSSCAISDSLVVFGNAKGTVFCLNLENGKLLWEFQTNGAVYCNAMIDDRVVYIGSEDSVYYALNLTDGSVLWKYNTGSKIISGSGVFNNSVIFGCVDGSVYSLNKASGGLNWKFSCRGVITASPCISGDVLYITSFDSYLYCLSASSGDLLWSYRLENKSRTTPVVWKNYLFVTADNILYCFSDKRN